MNRRTALSALFATGLVLTGCAGNAAPSVSSELTRADLDVTVRDESMGHEIRISGVVRNFDYPGNTNAAEREIVLVKIDATAGSKYSGTWGPANTFLRDGKGQSNQPLRATQILAAMKPDGYSPYNVDQLQAGKKASGWIPYAVQNPRTGTLDFVTEHLATRIMNGPTIEREEYSVRIAG